MDEFDQIGISQQSFLKHILQKPVVNTRRPNASAVEELRRYASFIGTSNHKDLLTDTSGSRRFIGVEVTGVIDVVRPIDYEQLYAQAMAALRSNERYWFALKTAIAKIISRDISACYKRISYHSLHTSHVITGQRKRKKRENGYLLRISFNGYKKQVK